MAESLVLRYPLGNDAHAACEWIVVDGNGVPTGAAKKGVNHRLKIRRGKRRPSFIDTGILRTNFVSWVDR